MSTLAERNQLIDRTVQCVKEVFPGASPAVLFELASHELARSHGLAVSPDEIMRVLSALAEAKP